jgi:hypothetical protein
MMAMNLPEKVKAISFARNLPFSSGSVAVIVQVILAAIFVGTLIVNMLANEHTANNVERREIELKYVKQSASHVKSILQQITDKPTAKKVERLYDTIHASPVKSSPDVQMLEKEIISEINYLDQAARENNLAQVDELATKLTRLAEERNRKLM